MLLAKKEKQSLKVYDRVTIFLLAYFMKELNGLIVQEKVVESQRQKKMIKEASNLLVNVCWVFFSASRWNPVESHNFIGYTSGQNPISTRPGHATTM